MEKDGGPTTFLASNAAKSIQRCDIGESYEFCTVLDGVERKSRVRFYVFVDITRSTCRTVLIFVPLETTMFELHFTYLERVHIFSRKAFRRS